MLRSAIKPAVLVTGAAGYLGSHATLALLDAGYPVIAIDNLSTGFRGAVDRRAIFHEGDIENGSFVRSLMQFQQVGAVMHFAGSADPDESVRDPLKYYRNNTCASRSLIENAIACGVPHFVYSTTAAIYGCPVDVPVPESAERHPLNPHAMSKLLSEAILADAAAAHGLSYGIVRWLDAAGADPDGRSGPSATSNHHMIAMALEVALGKRDHVTIAGIDLPTPDGSTVRDYVHVSDLADAHVAVLEGLLAEPARNLCVNCGYGRGFSTLEILDAVERVTNVRIERVHTAPAPHEPPVLVTDNRMILETLDWQPRFADLEEIVRSTYQWELGSRAALG